MAALLAEFVAVDVGSSVNRICNDERITLILLVTRADGAGRGIRRARPNVEDQKLG